MPAALRHLALRCRDMEKSRKFYEEVIGWRFVGYRPSRQGLDLSDGTNNITLIQHPREAERRAAEEGNEFIHFGVIVDDLDAVWQRLHEWATRFPGDSVFSKENVKERNPIDAEERPQVSFKALDPDGNVVDITCSREEWRGVTI